MVEEDRTSSLLSTWSYNLQWLTMQSLQTNLTFSLYSNNLKSPSPISIFIGEIQLVCCLYNASNSAYIALAHWGCLAAFGLHRMNVSHKDLCIKVLCIGLSVAHKGLICSWDGRWTCNIWGTWRNVISRWQRRCRNGRLSMRLGN